MGVVSMHTTPVTSDHVLSDECGIRNMKTLTCEVCTVYTLPVGYSGSHRL